MDIEALLAHHWDGLLTLRAEHLGDILSTRAADREKLEYAINNIYRLANLAPPTQIIWFDSQFDVRLAVALWMWMLDPHMHAAKIDPNYIPTSPLLKNSGQWLETQNQKLQSDFPRLFSETEEPELLLSQQFAELFQTQLDSERSQNGLVGVLSTAAIVATRVPIRIAVIDGMVKINRLLAFIEDPQVAIDASVRQALEDNLDKHDAGVEQELFGPALSMNLRQKMINPINRELSETIENGVVDSLLEPYNKVKDILRVKCEQWDRIGRRISTISDPSNSEFRSCLARKSRRLAALNCARSSMARCFSGSHPPSSRSP